MLKDDTIGYIEWHGRPSALDLRVRRQNLEPLSRGLSSTLLKSN